MKGKLYLYLIFKLKLTENFFIVRISFDPYNSLECRDYDHMLYETTEAQKVWVTWLRLLISDRATSWAYMYLQKPIIFLFSLWLLKNTCKTQFSPSRYLGSQIWRIRKLCKYYNSNKNINTLLRRFNLIKVERYVTCCLDEENRGQLPFHESLPESWNVSCCCSEWSWPYGGYFLSKGVSD